MTSTPGSAAPTATESLYVRRFGGSERALHWLLASTFLTMLATGLVLTTASGLSYLVDRFLLQPFDLQYLKLLSFIVVIAASMQLCELLIRRFSPLLHRLLGIYVPLLASNCALLGVALLNSTASRSFVAALFYGAGASLGFGLALALIAGLRERLQHADVPLPFRGAAIVFVTAGILSLAFLGFAGFARL